MRGNIKKVILFEIRGSLNEPWTHLFSFFPGASQLWDNQELKIFVMIFNFALGKKKKKSISDRNVMAWNVFERATLNNKILSAV